jgi:hypothetical protein
MTTSNDLIDALLRRQRRSLRPEPAADGFPEGWRNWLDAQRELPGSVSGAEAPHIVDVFLAREPGPPPAVVAQLGRWRAFASLWRQEWHPSARDERGLRIFAMVASALLHIAFSVLLGWLMYARFVLVAGDDPATGSEVVQVEFLGDGTPVDSGGAAGEEDRTAQAADSAPPIAAPSVPRVTAPLPEPASSIGEVTAAEEPPTMAQPLQVTETPQPDTRFVLPPTRTVAIDAPPVAVREITPQAREIVVLEVPQLPPLEASRPRRQIAVPDLQQPPVNVSVRDIPEPLPEVRARPMVSPGIPTPEIAPRTPVVRGREVPMPDPRPSDSSGAGASKAADPGLDVQGSRSAAERTPGPAAGMREVQSSAGTGAAVTPRPGAAPAGRTADDWGSATRSRPGGEAGRSAPGLFNADGSPRLAGGGQGRSGGGLPPGTITEDYDKIDRMGSWLKRPPVGYEPTAFDRFWVPHENLLQEWVRRSIKEVLIPIPGTTKTIRCAVALLALGGACGISDPNLVDVEANARKPPDVPFKPELQDDQESLRRVPGGP